MKWEYKTIKTDAKGCLGGKLDKDVFEELLNGLGQQGWELVNAFASNHLYGASRYIFGVLKRPIQ